MNLVGALQIAAFYRVPEVCVYFCNLLFRGCRCSKVDATQLHAFDSPNMKPLVSVGIKYDVNFASLRPLPHKPLWLRDHFCSAVSILRIFPGEFTNTESTLE